ncbi:MAG: hypothetical protein KDJ18_04375 [Hyphomicrobiaceae bacterium]|nr:hypothetical protein [Hyphomicrobiaceae bacterium]
MVEKRDKGEHGAKTGAKEKKKKLKLTTPELMQRAVDQLRIWQADRSAELSCPACGAPGLKLRDRSSRPHAEWYTVKCAACALDDAIYIPMASHRPPA